MRVASAIDLTVEQERELKKLARSKRTSVRLAQRAQIVLLAAQGLQNKEIAAQLGVVEGTVKIHITNIFNKLGVNDRTQALIEAVKRGIVQIE